MKYGSIKVRSSEECRQRCLTEVTKLLVAKDLPFSLVLSKEFRDLCKAFAECGARAPVKGFSRDAITDERIRLAEELEKALKVNIKGNVVFVTTDH